LCIQETGRGFYRGGGKAKAAACQADEQIEGGYTTTLKGKAPLLWPKTKKKKKREALIGEHLPPRTTELSLETPTHSILEIWNESPASCEEGMATLGREVRCRSRDLIVHHTGFVWWPVVPVTPPAVCFCAD